MVVFHIFLIIILFINNSLGQQTPAPVDPNSNHCGYNIPTYASDCYKYNTTKSQCCAIGINNSSFACMPQSSSYFVNHGAKFNINGAPSQITCGPLGELDTGSFFGINYCGKGSVALTTEDCRPTGKETTCCFLKSDALTTNKGVQTLKTCLLSNETFQTTVIAQTLFRGSNTTLTCYNVTSTNGITYKITDEKSAGWVSTSIYAFMILLIFYTI